MSRITAAHIGIEQLSALTLMSKSRACPDATPCCLMDSPSNLTSTGSIPNAWQNEHCWTLPLRPRLSRFAAATGFHPGDAGVASPIERGGTDELMAASVLLEQMHEDEQLMQMTLHLLHKV